MQTTADDSLISKKFPDISLLTLNLNQRRVRYRLRPPPPSLAYEAFSPIWGEKAPFAGNLGAFSLRCGAEVQRETV